MNVFFFLNKQVTNKGTIEKGERSYGISHVHSHHSDLAHTHTHTHTQRTSDKSFQFHLSAQKWRITVQQVYLCITLGDEEEEEAGTQ